MEFVPATITAYMTITSTVYHASIWSYKKGVYHGLQKGVYHVCTFKLFIM